MLSDVVVALFNAIAKSKRETAEQEAEQQAVANEKKKTTAKDIRLKTKSKDSQSIKERKQKTVKTGASSAGAALSAADVDGMNASKIENNEGVGKWAALRDDGGSDKKSIAIKVFQYCLSFLLCMF